MLSFRQRQRRASRLLGVLSLALGAIAWPSTAQEVGGGGSTLRAEVVRCLDESYNFV